MKRKPSNSSTNDFKKAVQRSSTTSHDSLVLEEIAGIGAPWVGVGFQLG